MMQLCRTGFVLFGLLIVGRVWGADLSPPPHPTGLFTEYRGKRFPVVAVEKEDPVINVDGKMKRLRGNVPLMSERMPHYSGMKAMLTDDRIQVLQVMIGSEMDAEKLKDSKGATVGGYVEFSGTITPEQDLTNCFVALIAFDSGFEQGASDKPNAQMRVRQIQDLRAGQPTRIKFSSTPFLSGKTMQPFLLLFSNGDEVALNTASLIWPYFQRRERIVHAATVRQWLLENATGNRPAQALLQIPPLFETTDGLASNGSAVLVVGPEGTVVDISLTGGFPPAAESILTKTLGSWLFLPRIKEGRAETSRVTVPLKF